MSADERLVAIETKLAFQEDLLQSLNETVVMQATRIEQLQQRYQNLLERVSALGSNDGGETIDEVPPHY